MNPNLQNSNRPAQPQPDNTPLQTDVVGNIPLHQAAPAPVQPNITSQADDIDGIMKDVTRQLKQEDIKPPKHHWFLHKPKPVLRSQSAPVPPATSSAQSLPMPHQLPPLQTIPAKPQTPTTIPVMIIVIAVIVTGFLVVAAVSAFQK